MFEKLFSKKNKEKQESIKATIYLKSKVDIESKISEIFATTKVTQRIINGTNNPIELEVFIQKKIDKLIFSSFEAKVGNSMLAKSKVIKTEKAEEKYSDSMASGNAAIYTAIDKSDKNKIIVHIGNIPPKEELIFISNFLNITESSNNFNEYEFLRSIPVLSAKETFFNNDYIKGTLEIETKNKIINIDKKLLSSHILINDEKYENDNHKFIIHYEYDYSSINKEYIPSNTIRFNIENTSDNPMMFAQISPKNKNKQSFVLNYLVAQNKNINLNPALFIFLLDQSGSMSGYPMKVASKALHLFLQSLPVGSYYQLIGFNNKYKVYDKTPKEYNQKNIKESINIIEGLKGIGGTNIYDPLKYIYDSNDYDKISLPKNIFLLTDGEINNKKDTLNLIEKTNKKFSVYSFGIGNDFDEDLIKNAGTIGKGDYYLCRKIDGLNQVIASALNKICVPHIQDFKINTSIDKLNLYNSNEINKVIIKNKIYRKYYLLKEDLKENKITINMEYKEGKENIKKNYEIEPIELPSGDELDKLVVYNYLLNNKDLSEDERIKLALKYQIFIEGTSLFAQIELSEKTTEELKHQEIVKDTSKYPKYSKGDNLIAILDEKIKGGELYILNLENRANLLFNEAKEKLKIGDNAGAKRVLIKKQKLLEKMKQMEGGMVQMEEQKMMLENAACNKDVMSRIKNANQAVKEASKGISIDDMDYLRENMDDMDEIKGTQEELNDFFKDYDNEDKNENIEEELSLLKQEMSEEKSGVPKEEKSKKKLLKKIKMDKDTVMKIINTQNFIDGFWDVNDSTKTIQKIYENLFKALQELKDYKIDDIIAMTIIIIYFINNEHQELREELDLIIKKAELFIQNKVSDSYDNIIKKLREINPSCFDENYNDDNDNNYNNEVEDLSNFLAV